MKKLLFISFFLLAVAGNQLKAQFNYIGGGIALATANNGYVVNGYEYYNNTFGFDIRMSYDYSKKFKIVPDLKIYLPRKESFPNGSFTKSTVLAFNLNGHFILNHRSRDSFRLYLLAGAHVSGWSLTDERVTVFQTYDDKNFKFVPGANAGAGMQFHIGTRMLFFAEAKYVISQSHQLVFSPGLLYNF